MTRSLPLAPAFWCALASVAGAVTGADTITYALTTQAGQRAAAIFSSTNSGCSITVYRPSESTPVFIGARNNNTFSGVLAKGGDFLVRVALDPTHASNNETCCFALSFELSGP